MGPGRLLGVDVDWSDGFIDKTLQKMYAAAGQGSSAVSWKWQVDKEGVVKEIRLNVPPGSHAVLDRLFGGGVTVLCPDGSERTLHLLFSTQRAQELEIEEDMRDELIAMKLRLDEMSSVGSGGGGATSSSDG